MAVVGWRVMDAHFQLLDLKKKGETAIGYYNDVRASTVA
jgi:hypothetical protein